MNGLSKIVVTGLVVCLPCFQGKAQQAFRVMEYNIENFFDCRHDTLKNDTEFLPDALRGWNWNRFNDKRNKIAKVILAASALQVPDVVALCEVENAYCLESLTKYSPLRDAAYKYFITDSPDERGIDVAFLYQPATFRPLDTRSVRINVSSGQKPTRDLLHVAGKTVTGDTLDFIVCHLPSRAGGKRTETYRKHVAQTVRAVADSIASMRVTPYLIILGDFNDTPQSVTLHEELGALIPSTDAPIPSALYNLMGEKSDGTYRYKGRWSMLDQFIVSGSLLLVNSPVQTSSSKAFVLNFPFLLKRDERYGGEAPFRTYIGPRYSGGFSDHLPILLELTLREDW